MAKAAAKKAPTKPPAKKPATRKPAPGAMSCHLVPKRGKIPDLPELELWTRQNRIEGQFPIFCHVNFGAIPIDANGAHYRMFVRWARLRLQCEGFEAAPQLKKYSRVLGKTEAKIHAERVLREETQSGFAAKVRAKFGVGPISASGEAGGESKRSARHEEKVTAEITLPLVQNLPNLVWRIGDEELGDLRKTQGFLEGDYLHHDDPDGEALCHLAIGAWPKGRKIKATLFVSLATGVHVVPEGHYKSDAGVSRDERDGKFADAFRDRLRSHSFVLGMEEKDFYPVASHTLVEETPAGSDEP